MRKAICSILTLAAAVALAGAARAEEPKTEKPKQESVEQRQERRSQALQAATLAENWGKAIAVLDETINDKDVPADAKLAARLNQFSIWTTKKLDGARASAVAKTISEAKKDDPFTLNLLAWTILDTKGLRHRDLDVTLAIAKQAAKVTKYERADILDTLARAYYEKGDLDKALDFQTKAVEKAEAAVGDPQIPDEMKVQIKATLAKYLTEKASPSEKVGPRAKE
jgi:hypothetical protein